MVSDYTMALIEAVLFMENEPIDEKNLSRICNLDRQIILANLQTLQQRYQAKEHGLDLVQQEEGAWHFLPKRVLWDSLKERYGRKNDGRLSRAAMESLAIIAYSQPITRAELDGIRGVNSDGVIRLLSGRNLIQEVGKKDAPGRPTQYGTTKEFLRVFRLKSLAELPKLDELENKRFELN
jgi:segregation and condensation protein B